MSFAHRIDERTGIMHCTMQGRMTLADFLAALELITPGGTFTASRRLYDMRECTPDVSTAEVQLVAAEIARRDRPASRVAMVSGIDLTYGLLRQYEGFRQGTQSQIRVFRTLEPALAWLEGDG